MGNWKSPGGDVKMFTVSDGKFVFKWQGSKKEKIEIVKDHDNDLLSRLKNNAHDDNKANVTRENIDPNEHVLCAAMSLPLPSPTDNECEKDETFVDSYREIEEKWKWFCPGLANSKKNLRVRKERNLCLLLRITKWRPK